MFADINKELIICKKHESEQIKREFELKSHLTKSNEKLVESN